MAIIKATNSKASVKQIINYVTEKNKTETKFVRGINCNSYTAVEEMQMTKAQYQKEGGRQYAHIVQSFNPEDKITPEEGHQIGLEFIEQSKKLKGYEILIATHLDKGHLHNHIVVNSVSFENGKKFHTTKKDLEEFKVISNNLSLAHNLIVPAKGTTVTSFNRDKYKVIEKGATGKGKSFVLDTALMVSQILKSARSREEFIKEMEKQKYKVNWSDTRKHITFTTPNNKKIRNSNLEKTFKEYKFSKEGIENELQSNREQYENKQHISREQFREYVEGNKGTEFTNAELHKSAYERRYSSENDYRKRTGENKTDKSRDTEQNGIDTIKARNYAEKLRRESTTNIINWSERTEREQSESSDTNGSEQRKDKQEFQGNSQNNKREFRELSNRFNENYGKDREQDFGIDR